MTSHDGAYLHERMTASKNAAEIARHPVSRTIHLKLAAMYDERWRGAVKDGVAHDTKLYKHELSLRCQILNAGSASRKAVQLPIFEINSLSESLTKPE